MSKIYNRDKAVLYAKKWALKRNPKYYNYDNIGGDCTNFASQCIYAGSGVMNYTKTFGWYYINANNKSPSWSGVNYLYNFLTRNFGGSGPVGEVVTKDRIRIGDLIQLAFIKSNFSHSLVVTKIERGEILVATHTDNSLDRNLKSYSYSDIRFVHIREINV